MLSRLATIAAVALALAATSVAGNAGAAHAGEDDCYKVTYKDPKTGEIKIKIVCPGTPGGGGENAGGGTVKCFYLGNEVPCENQGAPWSAAHNCWVTRVDPQDPPPEGKADEDGDWYFCSPPPPYIAPTGGPPKVWIEGPATEWVNPGELAARAVASMDLEPIGIGIVPEAGQDRMGLIGLPVWMWVGNPAPNTFGPITRSASAAGVTVTATASVARVVWDMGDGSDPITCGAGTPYADRYGKSDSPTCGHRYQRTSADQPDGAYQVTATSYWIVEWAGGGMTGQMEFDLSSVAAIRVGEAQVLTQ
ncbi:hypothetical protein [Nocardioides zeicaulis]|uniref:ATP/GTP-binding protein n=1 Tax=Nocardioides zeicaulis TaxID=1776857 RepID=A0ABV6DWZ0_9ACTN